MNNVTEKVDFGYVLEDVMKMANTNPPQIRRDKKPLKWSEESNCYHIVKSIVKK